MPVELALGASSTRRQEVEQQVLEILDFLEVILGPFPYKRLGATEVVVPMGLGFDAFSAPMRFVSPRLWSAGRDILVHELSHQWAGNSAIRIRWRAPHG